MAQRAACLCPGCRKVMPDGPGRCEPCERKKQALDDHRRGSASARGYGRDWRRNRLAALQAEPWCRVCRANGMWVLAELLDHVRPHRGDAMRFWRRANWQPLCGPCHTAKTAAGE